MLMNYYLKKFEFKKKVIKSLDSFPHDHDIVSRAISEWDLAENAFNLT